MPTAKNRQFHNVAATTLILLACLGALLTSAPTPVQAAQDVPAVSYRFLPVSGATLEALAAGESGEGIITYFTAENGPDKPAVAVRLSKAAGATTAQAEVFGALLSRQTPALQTENGVTKIDSTLKPDIIITTNDGWWVRDGVTSYNLDVEVYGPIASMWGAPSDTRLGAPAWVEYVMAGELAARIKTGDPQHSGIPQWDLRSLGPSFPGQGFVRSNYAERKCESPTKIDGGVSPVWPFVASAGGYEQPIGELRSPIVADWATGRIDYFSELVTVRNQNCSYALYSLNPWANDKHNRTDFEAPFAFYDLSGAGQSQPDLIMRTQRQPVGDIWFRVNNGPFEGRLASRDLQTIRYSWQNGVGDGTWDYKVEVIGFAPYTATTQLAGGLLSIDAPDWASFPTWVTGQSWPAATFVDPEGSYYPSSEGIYEWSPLTIGVPFLMGWQDFDPATVYNTINANLRGEYRFEHNLTPQVYFSGIDNRLHLLGAEGGVFNYSAGEVLREANMSGGLYIDAWQRESVPTVRGGAVEVREALYAPGDYLVYAGGSGDAAVVELRPANYQPATFTTLPPSDAASKKNLADLLAPYDGQRRDAHNLRSWLDAFPAAGLTLSGATLRDFRPTSDGFRFDLGLSDNFQKTGTVPGLEDLTLGRYSVNYDGTFHLTPASPPQLTVSIQPTELRQREEGMIKLALANSGQQDAAPATLELWATPPGGAASVVATATVRLLAGSEQIETLRWTPPLAGAWTLLPRLRLADSATLDYASVETAVAPVGGSGIAGLVTLALGGPTGPLLLLAAAAFMLVAALIGRRWLAGLSRQDAKVEV